MPTTANSELVRYLIQKLGLPRHCTRFVLTAKADDVLRVECEFYPDDASPGTLTKRYTLVEEPD